MIDDTVSRFAVRADRISLTGCSMGGFGAWEMGMTYTGFFAALAPIAGGGRSLPVRPTCARRPFAPTTGRRTNWFRLCIPA